MDILNFSKPNLADLFAMVGWSIWYKTQCFQTVRSFITILNFILIYAVARLHEFHIVTNPPTQSPPLSSFSNGHLPSTPPFYKANFDGAIF